MVRVRRPSAAEIDRVLGAPGADFTYPEVGESRSIGTPAGSSLGPHYDVDCRAFPLGNGRATFERACDALARWKHFEIPWLEFHGGERRVEDGQVVATLVAIAGFWFLNPCRVLPPAPLERPDRFEFSYGTLPGHAETGEERFRVAIDSGTGLVQYEIAAFSRPAVWLTRLGYPFARRVQARFARASAAALARACSDRGA